MTTKRIEQSAAWRMSGNWPGLRRIADELYDICEDGGFEKTAAEVQSEMHVRLLGVLGPLLDKFDKLIFLAGGHVSDATKKECVLEIAKWRR